MSEKKPHCSRCHRALKDPFSIAVGMGPECRGGLSKKGWKFPKAKYTVQGGRVVFAGVIGKIEPPVGDVTRDEKGRKRKAEGGRQKAEGRKQKAEDV